MTGATQDGDEAPGRGAWWPGDAVFRRPVAPFSRRDLTGGVVGLLAAPVGLRALVYLRPGPQLILDDWSILAAIRLNGWLRGRRRCSGAAGGVAGRHRSTAPSGPTRSCCSS